jgi:hypothetical protein
MKTRRWLIGTAIAGGLILSIVGLLAFAHAHAHLSGEARCFVTLGNAQWPKWIGCAMAAHENLAGGLIGLAGAIFAAWLAYSGAQDQLRSTNKQLRAAARLRAEERLNEATSEFRTLTAARTYLASFVVNFPKPNRPNYYMFDFAALLLQLKQRAHVYISESASAAPGEFGRRILKETWRINALAENAEARRKEGHMSFQDLRDEIRGSIDEIWRIVDDLDHEISRREVQLANLREQLDQFSA